MGYIIALAILISLLSLGVSLKNRTDIKKGGKITEDGVISPKGKDIIKKEDR